MTGATQRGSLPFYLGVVLLVLIVIASTVLALSAPFEQPLRLWNTPLYVLPVGILVFAAVFAARARRRLTAVILVGIGRFGFDVTMEATAIPGMLLTAIVGSIILLVIYRLIVSRRDRPVVRT